MVLIFYMLVFQEYWVLTESRIPPKPVQGGMRIVAQSLLFSYILGSLFFSFFLKYPGFFFQNIFVII